MDQQRGHRTASTMRKVLFDDYTNRFYVETRLEALERQVATRAKQTYVLNRSHDTRLRTTRKQVIAEHVIFHKKSERESTFHKDQLKDHVAHRHVLNGIAQSKLDGATGRRAESHLGFYGVGASKIQIQAQIEQRMRENTRSALRRKKSFRILRERRGVPVFDRTKTTSALLRMETEIQSRPMSDFRSKSTLYCESKPPLVLPPITNGTTCNHQGSLLAADTLSVSSECASTQEEDVTVFERERTPGDNVSSRQTTVFLTQSKS